MVAVAVYPDQVPRIVLRLIGRSRIAPPTSIIAVSWRSIELMAFVIGCQRLTVSIAIALNEVERVAVEGLPLSWHMWFA